MVDKEGVQIMSEDKKPKKARPWDLLNKNIERVGAELSKERLDICKDCKFFVSLTQQCLKCGCHMPWKTTLPHAECPIHKWEAVDVSDVSFKEEIEDN